MPLRYYAAESAGFKTALCRSVMRLMTMRAILGSHESQPATIIYLATIIEMLLPLARLRQAASVEERHNRGAL